MYVCMYVNGRSDARPIPSHHSGRLPGERHDYEQVRPVCMYMYVVAMNTMYVFMYVCMVVAMNTMYVCMYKHRRSTATNKTLVYVCINVLDINTIYLYMYVYMW
jgi:hypothetical protein